QACVEFIAVQIRTAIRQRSFVSQRIAIMMQSGYRAPISRKSVVDTTPATPARTDRRTVSMAQQLLMPKATAVWLVDNTALSFDQIATFCKLHPLEVKAIADGEAAQGIKGLDPIATGQLSRDEIARAEANPNHKLKLSEPKVRV